MQMFVQYAPYRLAEGSWDERKEAFADRCIDLVEEVALAFARASLVARCSPRWIWRSASA